MAEKLTLLQVQTALMDVDCTTQNLDTRVATIADLAMRELSLDPSKMRLELVFNALDIIKREVSECTAYVNGCAHDAGGEHIRKGESVDIARKLFRQDEERSEAAQNGK